MDYEYMGSQIRKRRRELGRTQEWLAEKAEVSTSFVGHIERGSRKASLETLVKISLVLQCTLDALAMPPHSDLQLDGYTLDELKQAQRLLEAALTMSKGTTPIIGVTKVSQVEDAAKAMQIALSKEEMNRIEQAAKDTAVNTRGSWESPMV